MSVDIGPVSLSLANGVPGGELRVSESGFEGDDDDDDDDHARFSISSSGGLLLNSSKQQQHEDEEEEQHEDMEDRKEAVSLTDGATVARQRTIASNHR